MLFSETDMEYYCDEFLSKFEELDAKTCSFEDIILKHALLMKKTITDTATFLFRLFHVNSFIKLFRVSLILQSLLTI